MSANDYTCTLYTIYTIYYIYYILYTSVYCVYGFTCLQSLATVYDNKLDSVRKMHQAIVAVGQLRIV